MQLNNSYRTKQIDAVSGEQRVSYIIIIYRSVQYNITTKKNTHINSYEVVIVNPYSSSHNNDMFSSLCHNSI